VKKNNLRYWERKVKIIIAYWKNNKLQVREGTSSKEFYNLPYQFIQIIECSNDHADTETELRISLEHKQYLMLKYIKNSIAKQKEQGKLSIRHGKSKIRQTETAELKCNNFISFFQLEINDFQNWRQIILTSIIYGIFSDLYHRY
jgi:hypothetical protein